MKWVFLALAGMTMICHGVPVNEMKREVFKNEGSELPYRWVRTPGEGDPALVLFLHGAGERGDDNEAQLVHGVADLLARLEKEGEAAVVVAPQCPKGVWWADLKGDFRSPEGGRLEGEASPRMALVFGMLDQLMKPE
ncbi:MAG: hypothetical protein ACO3RV_01620 [Luteolibacter sp.]